MKKRLSIVLILSMLFLMVIGTATAQAAPKKFNMKRFYGQNRFQTSFSIASQLDQGQQVQNVVLASAYSFPDALAAGTLAKKLNAPIILMGRGMKDSLESISFIKSHLVSNGTVTIVGGVGVIPREVEQWLLNNGYTVTRLGGSDRFATDANIINQLNVPKGTPIIIASGYDFPDALGISSIAASKGWPILLTGPRDVPQNVLNAIQNIAPTNIYVVGGTGVISQNVVTQIQAAAPSAQIQRFGGSDRFETLSLILTKFYPNPSQIYLANGYDFADALSGSTLAAANNAPILLVDPGSKDLPLGVRDYLVTLRNNGITPQVNVLGGTGAVPDRLVDEVNDILQSGSQTPTTPPSTNTESLAVSNVSINGFTVSLSPALDGLTASNFSLLNSSGYTVAITGATTSNGGASYALSAALTPGQTYTVTATAAGYTFSSAQSVTVPTSGYSETLTVSNPSTTGFTVALSPALSGLTTGNFTILNSAGYPVAIAGAATTDGGATYAISVALSAGQTYTVSAAASGYTFSSAQSITVPTSGYSETLTAYAPSTTGFTVALSPALSGLTAGNFTIRNSAGYPVAIASATTTNGGATYAISVALSAGQTYTVSAAATGYTFGSAQSVTVPSGVINEAMTVYAPSTTGFTLALSPALNGLTAGNFTIRNSAGYPVAIAGATTANSGATYAISVALNAGQTYTVTATTTGYSFGSAQSFTVPSTVISEALTVSNPSTTGFTVSLSPALNGLTASNFTLRDSSGNLVGITGASTSNSGATYQLSAVLGAGQTYTVTATATGYSFGTAQSVSVPSTISEILTVSSPSTSGFTVTLNPALDGLTTSNFILRDSAGNTVAITNASTSNGGVTYAISAALNAGQTYSLTATAPGYTFGTALNIVVPS